MRHCIAIGGDSYWKKKKKKKRSNVIPKSEFGSFEQHMTITLPCTAPAYLLHGKAILH